MLPPNQIDIGKLRVLNISDIPDVDISSYKLKVHGKVARELKITYNELLNMPNVEKRIPAHCVEGWSVSDLTWDGVEAEEIIKMAEPDAEFVMLKSLDGYSTVLPFEHFRKGIFALRLNGNTIPKEHGYPVRFVVPDLYFWKSAKWVYEVEFIDEYRDGFWEIRGYHPVGDVWLEQRRK